MHCTLPCFNFPVKHQRVCVFSFIKLVSLSFFFFPFQRALGNQKSTVVEFSNKDASEINSEQDKENSLIKSEPRRIKIFDGGQVQILLLKCTFKLTF